jgi:D-arabinose 1-dehydrogenase-like Zn-dependent alcohol dehydrogenase
MNSYQIVEWGKPLRLIPAPTPEPMGTEVLVKVRACGVCHSDVHIGEGHFDMGDGRLAKLEASGTRLPFTMGHEIVGRVAAAGPDSRAVVGSRCAVYPWIGCGSCAACLAGREIYCALPRALGVRAQGGYSDYVLVPDERYLLDYGALEPDVAATCGCSALTAYAALKKLPALSASDHLLIIGAGGLGLAALGLVRRISPARVVVADVNDAKLELARGAGADAVANTAKGPEALRAALGSGAAAVIDFVGAAATVGMALRVSSAGATIVVVGLFGGSLPLSTALLPLRSLSLVGSYVGSIEQMRELLALLNLQNTLRVPLQARPMSEVNAALDDLRAGRVNGRVVLQA